MDRLIDFRTEKTKLSSRAWALHQVQAACSSLPSRELLTGLLPGARLGKRDPEGPQPEPAEPASGGPSGAAQLPPPEGGTPAPSTRTAGTALASAA